MCVPIETHRVNYIYTQRKNYSSTIFARFYPLTFPLPTAAFSLLKWHLFYGVEG